MPRDGDEELSGMTSTVIVDYGMGNLRSVQKAFERIGEPAVVSSDWREIANADRVVLPGVGAFRDAIAALRQHDLTGVLRDHIASDRPFLGICLGLQLLMDVSFEDGEHEGLGVIPGCVRRFSLPADFKVPHMGWNQLKWGPAAQTELRNCLPASPWFYFVHSYHVIPGDPGCIAATADYDAPFVAAVQFGQVLATQFHPEKSQQSGQLLLKYFTSATSRPAVVPTA
jgi:glutamine amidotransferase